MSENALPDTLPFKGEVAIVIGATGPYHIARLKALHELLSAKQCSMTLVLRNGKISEYPWFDEPDAMPFPIVKAFSNDDPEPSSFQSGKGLYRALTNLKPDAIVFGMPSNAYFGAFAWGLKNRARMILFSESKADDSPRKIIKERLKKSIYGRFDAAVVGGKPHVEYLSKFGIAPENCFMGYDAVDNDYFERKAAVARCDDVQLRLKHNLPDKYWIAANRFIPKKNLLRLLEAYSQYKQSVGDDAWKLVVMGDGPDKEKILERRSQLGLEDDVLFPGLVMYDSLPEYYSLAKAFIHASTTEQWGLVVNEAMASGLPIVISETCGCASTLLEDGANGFGFNPFDTNSMTDAMVKFHCLTANEQIEMAARSQELVGGWGPSRFAEATWSALNSVRA